MTQPQTGVVSAHSDADGILIVRVFDAPRELVYQAWTRPEHFAAWFGEHGSSMPVDTVEMDARPGGAWSAIMHVPGEGEGGATLQLRFFGEFREVREPEHVVMTIDTGEGSPGAEELISADFRDLGDGRTEMTFTQRGGSLPADEYSRALRGELIFFDRLAAHLAEVSA